MNSNYYELRDNCRNGLSKYTIKAFSYIPKIDSPLILDMGCGSGLSSLALIEICNCNIYAVDSDDSCLIRFKKKVNELNYTDKIKIINSSVFDTNIFNNKFDIVLAEGLLNVIGFEKGLPILINHLKQNGYLLIHDELDKDIEKRKIFSNYNLTLMQSFILDENIWWNDYYYHLEYAISKENNNLLFEKDLCEIWEFKKNPQKFKSIYYILHKKIS